MRKFLMIMRSELLWGTLQVVVKMGRYFCAEVPYLKQFTTEIISLGWSSGLHGCMQVVLHLCFVCLDFNYIIIRWRLTSDAGIAFSNSRLLKNPLLKHINSLLPHNTKPFAPSKEDKIVIFFFFFFSFLCCLSTRRPMHLFLDWAK